jgi:hypothetical protein
MRTVADLRLAMTEATKHLAPRVTFADVRRRAQRRRLRRIGAVLAAVAPMLAVLLAVELQPASPSPAPSPTRSAPMSFPPSFPPVGDVIATGVAVGADELVFWFHEGPFLSAGLRDTAGAVRPLDPGGGGDNGFGNLGEIDDRHGGIVDYGLFLGNATAITVSTGGRPVAATLATWSGNTSYHVFWARRTGTAVPPTGAPATAGAAQPQFTAYDLAGRTLARSDGPTQRTDGAVNIADSPRIGDLIHTGTPAASGRELVLWFTGDDNGAVLHAGEWDPGTGTAKELRGLENVTRPPFGSGFYHGYQTVDGPRGTKIVLSTYVGPADRVVMAHAAPGVTTGSAHWSAYPQLILGWAANVPADSAYQMSAVALDVSGKTIAATDFHN